MMARLEAAEPGERVIVRASRISGDAIGPANDIPDAYAPRDHAAATRRTVGLFLVRLGNRLAAPAACAASAR